MPDPDPDTNLTLTLAPKSNRSVFADVLHELPHVEHIILTGNRLTDEGIRSVIQARVGVWCWSQGWVYQRGPIRVCLPGG